MMWPAGAIEDNGVEHGHLTKEEMDAMQEQDRKALEDRWQPGFIELGLFFILYVMLWIVDPGFAQKKN